MTFIVVLNIIQRVIGIVLGTTGLLLVLRLVLHFFKLPESNPFLRGLTVLTDPLLRLTHRLLSIPTYSHSLRLGLNFDLLGALATLLLLWALQSILSWALQLLHFAALFTVDPLGTLGQLLILIINIAFQLYSLALLLRVLFEWLRIPYTGRMMRFLWNITEPLLAPIRRLLPSLGGWDFSPLVAYLLIGLLRQIVSAFLAWIFLA
ncbi:MAG TPA: YggT family protein [Anaerolineae bacterium]|nr:YggT family protein [Anaerolineae bacterium]